MSGSLPGLLQSLSCWAARGGAADWWRDWQIWLGTYFTNWSQEGAKHRWDKNVLQHFYIQYSHVLFKLFRLFSYTMKKVCGYFMFCSRFSRHIWCFRLRDSVCVCFAASVVFWVIHTVTLTNPYNAFVRHDALTEIFRASLKKETSAQLVNIWANSRILDGFTSQKILPTLNFSPKKHSIDDYMCCKFISWLVFLILPMIHFPFSGSEHEQ